MIRKEVIYFPYINLQPNNNWYKSALLYWNGIRVLTPASIVPLEGETKALNDHEDKPLTPLWISGELKKKITPDFIKYAAAIKNHAPPINCYPGKFDDAALEELVRLKLAVKKIEKNPFGETEFYAIEGNTARLYLSMVAYEQAELHNFDLYTDDPDTLAFINWGKPLEFSNAISRHDNYTTACLNDCLPVPRDDVPFEKILEFKEKHIDKFIEFRNFVEGKFYNFQDLDNLGDDKFIKIRSEIKESINENIRSLMIKELGSVRTLSLGIVDISTVGAADVINLAGKILKLSDAMIGAPKVTQYQYLALVDAHLGK